MIRNYSYYWDKLEDVNDIFQSIKITGYTGEWSAIQSIWLDNNAKYFLFEHDYYGDETCFLVVRFKNIYDENGMDIGITEHEIYETYDGLIQCLIDEDIINTSCADWSWD